MMPILFVRNSFKTVHHQFEIDAASAFLGRNGIDEQEIRRVMKDNFSVIWHCLVQRAQDVSIVKKTLKSHAHLHLSAVWRRDAGREIHSFIKTRCSMYKFWLTLHHPSRLMHSRKRMSWMQSHYYGRRGGPHYSNWEKSGTATTTGHREDDAKMNCPPTKSLFHPYAFGSKSCAKIMANQQCLGWNHSPLIFQFGTKKVQRLWARVLNFWDNDKCAQHHQRTKCFHWMPLGPPSDLTECFMHLLSFSYG